MERNPWQLEVIPCLISLIRLHFRIFFICMTACVIYTVSLSWNGLHRTCVTQPLTGWIYHSQRASTSTFALIFCHSISKFNSLNQTLKLMQSTLCVNEACLPEHSTFILYIAFKRTSDRLGSGLGVQFVHRLIVICIKSLQQEQRTHASKHHNYLHLKFIIRENYGSFVQKWS